MKTLLILAVIALMTVNGIAATSTKTSGKGGARKASATPQVEPAGPLLFSDPDPYNSQTDLTPQTPIDELVLAKLKKAGVQPAKVCSDAVFIRRVFLDVIGTLPTPEEVRTFLADRSPDKRSVLIDRLLKRDEFADYWSLKWGDLLRIKAEFPINLWPNAAQAYSRWVRTCLQENMPYDQFVREMLTSSGSNFRVPPVNFYRAMQNRTPEGIAQTVALTFMGTRAESWPKEQLAGLSVFFSKIDFKSTGEWKEEIVRYDPSLGTNVWVEGVLPDGKRIRISPEWDGRKLFAKWLIDPQNPWFTRNIANRVWSWLLGRGIIHEPDDLRADNPPSNPELLALLERELIKARYDLKQLYRVILNSKTYQLSSIPKAGQPADDVNFSHYPLRRMEAEVLIDALCQITGTTEQYYSAIPEPFTFIPEDMRSIDLPDGSISSSFLELFGRPPRDTGMEMERNPRPTAGQRLHLLNSSHIQHKLENGRKLQALLASTKRMDQIVGGLYLMILSRYPTEEEVKIALTHSPADTDTLKVCAAAATDIAWALINSTEFLYRH